jgi:hypothetical protein
MCGQRLAVLELAFLGKLPQIIYGFRNILFWLNFCKNGGEKSLAPAKIEP